MSVRTRAHHTKSGRSRPFTKLQKAPWREVARKEISRFSEAGVTLRGCRYKENMTQIELSKAIGINQHHISEMENGKRPVGKEMAKRLAKFFDVDYRVFL